MIDLTGGSAFVARDAGPDTLEIVELTPQELALAEYDVGPVAEEREQESREFRDRLRGALEDGRRRLEEQGTDPEFRDFHRLMMNGPRSASNRVSRAEWGAALLEHRGHAAFRIEEWAFALRAGFSCRCSGQEETWEGPLSSMFSDDEAVRLFRAMHLVSRLEPDTERRLSLAGARVEEYEAEVDRCHRRFVNRTEGSGEMRVRQAAHTRAEKLLRRALTREQWRGYRQKKAFMTTGQDGCTYRVEVGSSRNVVKVVDGVDVMRYCVVPKGEYVPVPDLMLAVKLMLEHSIDKFMQLANKENLSLVREERAG